MIIVMNRNATEQQLETVLKKIRQFGLEANISRGAEHREIQRRLD